VTEQVFRPLEILQAFVDCDVDFVLIGGIAMQAHLSDRVTKDIDLAVTFSRDNREKMAEALARVGARMMGPDGKIAKDPPSAGLLGGGSMWFFDTLHGKVDVVAPPGPPGGYPGLRERALELKVGDLIIPTASREDLLEMKRRAGRPQDLEDIKHLESLEDD
jgi:predicted nucleotidyltransferase